MNGVAEAMMFEYLMVWKNGMVSVQRNVTCVENEEIHFR